MVETPRLGFRGSAVIASSVVPTLAIEFLPKDLLPKNPLSCILFFILI